MRRKKVAVIGAGISGLIIGNELSKSGFDVIVIEKNNHIGGLSSSFKHDGFIFDYGPHKLYSQISGMMDYIRQILGNECLTIKKKNSIRLLGSYIKFPLIFTQFIKVIKMGVLTKCAFSYFKASLKNILNKPKIVSYEDCFVNKFGPYIYNLIFKDFAWKVWGDPKYLSDELARRRIPVQNISSLIKKSLNKKSDISADYFYYPKFGMVEICNIIAKDLKNNGGKLILNSHPISIITKNKKIDYLEYIQNKHKRKIKIDYVVSTMHIKDMLAVLNPRPSKHIFDVVNNLKYRSIILFYLIIEKGSVLEDNWIFFPEKKYVFNRVSEQKNFSSLTAPENKTAIIAEITYDPGNKIFDNKKSLYERVVSDLEDADIIKKEWIMDFFAKRIEKIYPVYNLEFRKNLDIIFGYLDGIEKLYSIGRHGLFNYNNIDHCIDMSLHTAKHIISGETKEKWKTLLNRFNNYRIVD